MRRDDGSDPGGRLTAEQADLVFAASDYVYEHVVRNCDGRVDPATFEHMGCQVKESHVSAWVHLAGRVGLPLPDLTLVSVPLAAPPLAAADARASVQAPGPLPVAPPLGKLPPEVRGRDGLIGELRRALRPYPWRASRAFVIAGMGGLGKSTVALTAGAYLGSPFAHWSTFAGYRQALDGVELPAALMDIEEQGADIHATCRADTERR